jgi:SAM-dependent methyltransferase
MPSTLESEFNFNLDTIDLGGKCPLCTAITIDKFIDAAVDLHYSLPGYWGYRKCTGCKVLFLDPAPTSDFLKRSYDDSYYSYQDFHAPPRWHAILKSLLFYDLGSTGDPIFDRPGRILDIGCGSGQFLMQMKLKGWETFGVEISQRAAKIGNAKYQLNIQAGELKNALLPKQSFDYIRLNHSFEHLLDPRATLVQISKLLKPDGKLFIGVPNTKSLQAFLFGKYWWNLGPPVHPFNYSKDSIAWLLQEHGFEIVSFRTHSNFAGILGSLQMLINSRSGKLSDTGRLFRNPIAKLICHWAAKLTDLFSCGDCLEVTAQLTKNKI